jgi:hypothetical protein
MLNFDSGYVQAYQNLDAAGREKAASIHGFTGIEQGKDTLEFLWQSQFAAVAADSPAFEVVRKSLPSLVPQAV